jgi:iron complex transport system substrate-binding protein
MKSLYALIVFVLMSVLILSGCGGTTPTETSSATPTSPAVSTTTPVSTSATTPVTPTTTTPAEHIIVDDAGRTVTIVGTPERIISLAPSNTEVLFALGLGDKVVGVTTYCNYPPEALDKPKVGGFSDVDIEKVVEANPDLILAANLHEAEVVPALEALDLTVVVINPETIEEIIDNIRMVGEIAGVEATAETLADTLQSRVDAVKAVVETATTPSPRVLYVTWHDPIWTAGDDTLQGELIKLAGGTNIAADISGNNTITLEAVVEKNPQIIIVLSSMGDQNTALEYINSEPRLQVTDALINHQVYEIDTDIYGRSTPRIVDALEELAGIINPDLF